MNLNKTLLILFSLLILFLAITFVQIIRAKNNQIEYMCTDTYDEIFITNSHCVPEIIRSYEKIKGTYSKKNILFFRYGKNTCNYCIYKYLTEILALQEEIGRDYIWIFPAYPNDRGHKIQLSNELAKYNYCNIPADSLLI